MPNTKPALATNNNPFQRPWTDRMGQPYQSLGSWMNSRKFSLVYMILSILIVCVLGFASRRNCDGPWQIVFQCNWTLWVDQFSTDFWHFVATCFTAPWFHNDLAHILVVGLAGTIFPIQSFEVQHGTKKTVFLFFLTYLYVGLLLGAVTYLLKLYLPESSFVEQAINRTWMGGSVGIFGIFGGMAIYSNRTWRFVGFILLFEVFSYTVLSNNIYISIFHLNSVSFGMMFCYFWRKKYQSDKR